VGRSGVRAWTRSGCIAVTVGWILILALFYFLEGCASKQSQYEVRYVKGCAIDVSVMTADEAAKIMKDLKYRDCELDAEIGDEAKEIE
jgi:hypothetical protein